VGGISFIVDWGTLMLLTEVAGLHYLASAAIAFILGLTCNYILSTRFVFGESKLKSKWAEFLGFAIIGIIGLMLNEAIMYICTDLAKMHYLIGKVASTILVFFWNFLGRRFLLFKS